MDLEHEDDIPETDGEIEVIDDTSRDKEQPAGQKNIALDSNEADTKKAATDDVTRCIEVNVEKIDDKDCLIQNKETTVIISDSEDNNNMLIDDSCIENPTILTTSEEIINNIENNTSENTVLLTTGTSKESEYLNDNDSEKGTKNVFALVDDSKSDKTKTTLKTCDQENVNTEQDTKPNSDDIKNKHINPKHDLNDDNVQKSKAKDIERDNLIEVETKGVKSIMELKQDEAVLEKLKQLDPSKVEAEILFDSDSDDGISRETSPIAGTSGTNTLDIPSNNIEKPKDILIEEKSKPKVEGTGATDFEIGITSLEIKTEKSEEPESRRKRFVFADDEDSKEDDLCIAEIKRKKRVQMKNKIQFENDVTMEESDSNPGENEKTFAVSIIPLSGLSETAQSDLKDLLMRDTERSSEDGPGSETFNLGASRRPEQLVSEQVKKRTMECNEDDEVQEVPCEGSAG